MNRFAGKVMITGDESERAAVEALRAGCHDFLCKRQMDAEALHNAMVNALKKSREALLFLGQPPQFVAEAQRERASEEVFTGGDLNKYRYRRSDPHRGNEIDPADVERILSDLRIDGKTPMN